MKPLERIMSIVCRHYGVTAHAIQSRARPNHIAHPRMVVCWFATQLGYTSAEIALAVKRDRSNISNALHKVDTWRRDDRRFQSRFLPLLANLKREFPALNGL